MKKLQLSIAMIAMVAGVTGAFAFKEPVHSGKALLPYHYTSSSSSVPDMQNIANWVQQDPSCGANGSLPCRIQYNGNTSAFQTYIGTLTSLSAFLAAADEKKN